MVPKVPAAPPSLDGPHSGVSLAWRSLGGPVPDSIERIRDVGRTKPALYRLIFNGQASIYAKRSPTSEMAVERAVYQEILPGLSLTTPRCHGSCREDGSTWLFLEDVGRREFSVRHPEHRALASRWLARLHRGAAKLDAGRQLPEGGPPRYLRHLQEGRERIQRNLGNPGMTAADVELLAAVVRTLDRAQSRWDAIARACAVLPDTVVHGDFRPKNVRIREEATGSVLYALDWELAGWGSPVVDLGPARGAVATPLLDPEVYAYAVRGHGPALDRRAIERLSRLGYLLRRLAAIDWDSLSLHFEDPLWLLMPISSIRTVHRQLVSSLTHAEEWIE